MADDQATNFMTLVFIVAGFVVTTWLLAELLSWWIRDDDEGDKGHRY